MPVLSVDIVARFAQFQTALDQVVRSTAAASQRMDSGFANIGNKFKGLLVGVTLEETARRFAEFVKGAIDAADELGKVAQRTGIAIEQLSALKYAADLSNVSFEDLTKGLQFFNKNIDESDGAFKRLGLNLKEFKTPDAALEAVAERFSQIEDGAGKTAVAMQLFGKSGAALIPFLNAGKQGLRELREEAQRLGIIVTPEQARRAEEFNDNLTRLKASTHGLALEIADTLLPALVRFTDNLVTARKEHEGFIAALKAKVSVPTTFFGSAFDDVEKIKAQIEQLKQIKKELETQRAGRGQVEGSTILGGRPADIQRSIDLAERELKVRERKLDLQRRQHAADILETQDANANADARDLRLRQSKETLPDPTRDKSAITRAEREVRLARAKQIFDQERQLENISFARGEKSAADHFAVLLGLRRKEIAAELDAVEASLVEERKASEDAPSFTEKIKHDAEVIKLEGQKAALEKSRSDAARISKENLTDAQVAFNDSIKQTSAALLQSAGYAEKAAEKTNELSASQERLRTLVKTKGIDSPEVKEEQQRQKEIVDRGRLADILTEEDTVRERLNTRLQLQQNLRTQGGGFDAELRFLEDRNRALRESLPLLQQTIDKLETEIALSTTPGPARDKAQAQLEARRAQKGAIEAGLTPAGQVPERLDLAERKTAALFQEEQLKEAEIATARERGALTTLDALERVDAVRRESLAGLREQLRLEQEIIANNPNNEEARLRVEQLRVAIEHLGATANQVADQTRLIFEDAFVSPFEDLINKTKTADQALQAFFRNIAQSFLHLASKDIAQRLFGGLFSNTSASGETGIVSFFAGLLGGLGGSSAGATTTSAQAGITQQQYANYYGYKSALGNIMTSEGPMRLERYARGGITRKPVLSLAGEAGPEAIIPLPDGRSVPVTMRGLDSGTRVQAGPSAVTQWQRASPPTVTLQLHPDALHLSLRDWLEGEMARTLATR